MKPRLDLRFGVWCCRVKGERIAGFGYTPLEAYDEWLQAAWDAAMNTDAAAVSSAVNN